MNTEGGHLLPSNANQYEKALSLSTRFGDDILPEDIKTLWQPYSAPARFLPFLASSMHADFWHDKLSDEAKRAIIAQSFAWHRIKGTFGAIKLGLKMVGVDADVKAWHELGWDTPFLFTVRAVVGDAMEALRDEDVTRLVREIIEDTKAGRDVLATLELGTLLDDVLYAKNTDIVDEATITSVLGFEDRYRLPGPLVGFGYAGTARKAGSAISGQGRVGGTVGTIRAKNGVEDFGPLALTLSGFSDNVKGAVQRAGYSQVGSGDIAGPSASCLDGGARMTVVRVTRAGIHNRIRPGVTAGKGTAGCHKVGEGRLRVGYRNYETAV